MPGGKVEVTWGLKTGDSATPDKPMTLTVYYKRQLVPFNGESSVSIAITESSGSFDIDGLTACENYCFTAQITSPARSPVTTDIFTTDVKCTLVPDHEEAAPKDVQLHQALAADNQMADVTVMWRPPCKPIITTYKIDVEDDKGHTEEFSYRSNLMDYLYVTLTGFHRGANYSFYVHRDIPAFQKSDAVSSIISPFSAPMEFKVECYNGYSDTFLLTWKPPSDAAASSIQTYEVHHTTQYVQNHTSAVFSAYINTSSQLVLLSRLDPDEDHSFKVCMVSQSGYRSLFTNIITMKSLPIEKQVLMHLDDMNTQPPSAIGGLNVTLLAGLLVASVVIIVATSVALIVYVVRHRRLQQSFTSFANSHFDNRRGTTTFGSNDLEEEDQPMIRCFADDEPLIVA